MGTRVPTPCTHPGCRRAAVQGGRCTEHQIKRIPKPARQAKPRAKRPSAWSQGYDGEWRKISKAWLKAHPYCVVCGEKATHVDHIIPLRRGGDSSPSNRQSMCKPCHSTKTAKEDGRWG